MAAAICLSCSRSDLFNMGGMGGSTAKARAANNIKIVFMLVSCKSFQSLQPCLMPSPGPHPFSNRLPCWLHRSPVLRTSWR